VSEPCPAQGALVEGALSRIATEYREAERLKGYMSVVLGQIEDIARTVCAIPSFFDIDTAIGDQLTLIGKRIGFPRCHCVCDATPVIGFECNPPGLIPIAGFCEEATWAGCEGISYLCISDDEAYRAHLVARRYQMLGLYDVESLEAALRAVWGASAWIPEARHGRVVVAPGRVLTTPETQRLLITLRAMPFAPGIGIAVHFGSAPILGFGQGWGGFCVGDWLCPVAIDPYDCDEPPGRAVIGFSCGADDERPIAGFCDDNSTWLACLPS